MELLLLCHRHVRRHRGSGSGRSGIIVRLLGFWFGTLMMMGFMVYYYWNKNKTMMDFGGIIAGDPSSLTAAAAAETESSVILSETMTYMRYNHNNNHNIQQQARSSEEVGNHIELSSGNSCSCSNPYTKFDCCQRYIHQAHKMGIAMTKRIFFNDENENTTNTANDSDNHRDYFGPIRRSNHGLNNKRHHLDITKISLLTNTANAIVDYRDVMVFRNVYSALISGKFVLVDYLVGTVL